jgi:hypothetical protein
MSSKIKVSFNPQFVRQQGKRKLFSSPSKSKSRSQAAQNASRSRSRSIRSASVERFSYSPRSVRRMNTSRGATIHRAVPRSQYATYGSVRRTSPSRSIHRGFAEIKSTGRRNVASIKKSRRRVDSVRV